MIEYVYNFIYYSLLGMEVNLADFDYSRFLYFDPPYVTQLREANKTLLAILSDAPYWKIDFGFN